MFLHVRPTLGEDGSSLKPSLSYCGRRRDTGGQGERRTGLKKGGDLGASLTSSSSTALAGAEQSRPAFTDRREETGRI